MKGIPGSFRGIVALALALTLGACAIGSSTTQRPALLEPAVAPDGAFWDVVEVARRDNAPGFLHTVSPRFLMSSFLPEQRLTEPTSQRTFDDMRANVEQTLARVARESGLDLEHEKLRLAQSYLHWLREISATYFIEAERPEYDLRFKDQYGRASGPNRAYVRVRLHPKQPEQEVSNPVLGRVVFVQDGMRWLIDRFEPDPAYGAHAWAR